MNTLGQLKTLLDIQALRGFTDHSLNPAQNTGTSSFEELLQKSLIESDKAGEISAFTANSLGAVYNMSHLLQSQIPPVNHTGIAEKIDIPINKEISGQTKPLASNIEAIINKAADKYNLPAKLIKS